MPHRHAHRPAVTLLVALAMASLAPRPAAAQASTHAAHADSARDSSFAALQRRGKEIMGVDQYTSEHQFDALPDGGRIELQRDTDDAAGTRTIRSHLRAIAAAFRAGDFSTPAMVHLREVPGTRVMAARRAAIRYTVRDLPRGAELRMTTSDREAIAAIHEFMAFQRGDHRAGGRADPMDDMSDHAMHGMGGMHGGASAPAPPDSAKRPPVGR